MLTRDQVAGLSYEDKTALVAWQKANTSQGFIPAAIRRMPLETRLALAHSPELTAAWQRRERFRCEQSAAYLIEQYGSIEPPVGNPEPFEQWDAQLETLHKIEANDRTVILKARRLGLSWLVLHYALWIAGFKKNAAHSRILFLSKNLPDAKKMLARVKRVNDRLPPFLRIEPNGEDSQSTLGIRNGEITCLPATEGAARQETATLVVLDEFAFVKDGKAGKIWTAVQATIEGGGQLIVVSTGNGRAGDGAQFASLYLDAKAGRSTALAIFLAWNVRPDRTQEWLDAERTNYESDAAFNAEYPSTDDEALEGDRTVRVYPAQGVAAAERLGRWLWADTPLFRSMRDEGAEIGTDWGDFQTFTVYALPLPGGGIYVIDELLQASTEPQEAGWAILRHDPGGLRAADGGKAHIVESRTDSAPAGTNASYAAVVTAAQSDVELRGRVPEGNLKVPFSKYKQGGGERFGVNTIGFLRWLFKRTSERVAADGSIEPCAGVIAIHPRCKTLLAQLSNLERDPDTGKVIKPSADPKHPETGDHGPDALVALAAPRAQQWTSTKESDE